MKKLHYSCIIIVLCTVVLSCGKSDSNNTVVAVFTAGDVAVKSQGGDFRPLKVQSILTKGDTIKTGAKSHATLQMGMEGIVQIAAESTVDLVSLLENPSRELTLSSGKMLCRIDKLVKGGQFRVKTPTINAAVRGTVFSVSCNKISSTVALKKGSVTVTLLKNGKEETLDEGKTADIGEDISVRTIAGPETIELKKVEIFTIDPSALTAQRDEIEEKTQKIAPEIEKIDKELEDASPMTLEKIREKYGRIDVVTLYNGKVHRGAILSRGASWRMVTPLGQMAVPGNQVKNTGSQ